MFNPVVVLSLMAKLDKNRSKTFPYHSQSPECTHMNNNKEKSLYF